MLAQQVPGGVMLFDAPQPTVLVAGLARRAPDGERRFLLGRAFEPLRGGYALAHRACARRSAPRWGTCSSS